MGYLLMVAVPAALLTGSFVGARKQRLDWRDGLGLRLPTPRQALVTLLLFLMLSLVTEALYRRWQLEPTTQAWHTRYGLAALGVRMVFVALIYPIAEEVFFRGFLFGALRHRFGELAGIAGSSMAFAVLHVQYDLRGMVLVLVDAIFFSVVRARTNSTLLTIALHILGNSYAVWQRF